MKFLIKVLMFLLLLPVSLAFSDQSFDMTQLQKIAVQHEGRIKPLQTYASESMKILTGRERFEGKDPIENLLHILFTQDWAQSHPLIRINYRPLLKDVGLDVEQKYYSYLELTTNQKLMQLMEETVQKNQNQKQVSPYDRKVLAVYQQVSFLHSLVSGEVLALLPNPNDKRGYWTTVYEINAGNDHSEGTEKIRTLIASVGDAFQKKNASLFYEQTKQLVEFLRHIHPEAYPSEEVINREILYNNTKPFQTAWILYLSAFILSLILFGSRFFWLSLLPFITGFVYHTLGIVLRTLISGRAPVSNMYESMNFMVWGICLLAFIFQIFSKKRIFITVAGLLGFFILVLASLMPIDNGIP
ncbi:MAG: hypothetical protein Q8Q33_10470, partial [Chlamydiota bacterium]|nr:hypothetical protein [Chlamydiota bacterium]